MSTLRKCTQYRKEGLDNRTNLAKSTADALRKNFGSVIKIYRSSNAEGSLVTPEKLPFGKGYSIVEVQAPYGYDAACSDHFTS